MSDMENPLAEARRLLAEVEAECREAERGLHRMLSDGIDHFHKRSEAGLEGLNETTLSAWTQEQQALSTLRAAHDPFDRRDPSLNP